ncbi:hypothetical protein [Botrimarina mediterranea]|uniref:hypothetical protein n=1 Tax=Botrimarina mediterranea TaxID=2528022 RepID=UPI00118CED32|nr:hypothetical protein K2D_06000 [Planctomycetes bacterium K2D]
MNHLPLNNRDFAPQAGYITREQAAARLCISAGELDQLITAGKIRQEAGGIVAADVLRHQENAADA